MIERKALKENKSRLQKKEVNKKVCFVLTFSKSAQESRQSRHLSPATESRRKVDLIKYHEKKGNF